MATNNMINVSGSSCYMMENNAVYILDTFNLKNMGELIGQLSNAINRLQIMPTYKSGGDIKSPYDIEHIKNPIIDVYINSPGGDTAILNCISTLLNIAKNRGAIIRTTVLSNAYSCGSMLAIQGTPGFRIMSHNARHHVHFGSTGFQATKQEDLDAMPQILSEYKKAIHHTYLSHTKLTQKQLNNLMKNESGFLTAKPCLEFGLCDWIISEHGKLIGRTK